jgi:hypothetical protein
MVRRDEMMKVHVTLHLVYDVDPEKYPEGSDTTSNQIVNYEEESWEEDPVTMLDVIMLEENTSMTVEVEVK